MSHQVSPVIHSLGSLHITIVRALLRALSVVVLTPSESVALSFDGSSAEPISHNGKPRLFCGTVNLQAWISGLPNGVMPAGKDQCAVTGENLPIILIGSLEIADD